MKNVFSSDATETGIPDTAALNLAESTAGIVLPGSFPLALVQFGRDGADLILRAPDGVTQTSDGGDGQTDGSNQANAEDGVQASGAGDSQTGGDQAAGNQSGDGGNGQEEENQADGGQSSGDQGGQPSGEPAGANGGSQPAGELPGGNPAGAQNEPEANDDGPVATDEDTPVTILSALLLDNDTDLDGDALTVISVANTSGGSVALNAVGDIVFTPDADFNGDASFEYTISDGNGGTDAATVAVDVTPVNDEPVAVDDSGLTTAEDTATTIAEASLLDNDSDADGDSLSISGVDAVSAQGGAVTLNPDGSVAYTPGADFNGTDSFGYTISDGNGGTDTATITVEVTPVNDDPVAVDDGGFTTAEKTATTIAAASLLSNDSDADGDSLSITGVDAVSAQGGAVTLNPDGSVAYTPVGGFNGEDSFGYTVSDGNGGSARATVDVAVAELILGTNGPDVIDVSAESSLHNIEGLRGADTITGGSGNDTISGGASQRFPDWRWPPALGTVRTRQRRL